MKKILKKTNLIEEFSEIKIINAVDKSADRVLVQLSYKDHNDIVSYVTQEMENYEGETVPVSHLHTLVELALDEVNEEVAKSYRDYRNYKTDFTQILDEVFKQDCQIRYRGDKENSNTDSTLIPTRRSLVYNAYNKLMYRKFNMSPEELEACEDGYIYEHDQNARRDTMNCCLLDCRSILSNGFKMGNMTYTEPKYIDTACDVLSDIMMTQASSQYGGLTIPEIDKLLAPYVKKSYEYHYGRLSESIAKVCKDAVVVPEELEKEALELTIRDLDQGIQGFEMKFNSVSSSRGDYPFLTFTFGEDVEDPYARLVAESILRVRKNGQGETGKKQCVVFPKLVFLYVDEYHGEGQPYEYLFDLAIEASAECMYPDYLSLTGDDYVSSMYKKYKKIVSPMGQRIVA